MKITLGELYDCQKHLLSLSTKDLPSSVFYKLQRNLMIITKELVPFEKTRVAICEKYGKINKEKGIYEFEADKIIPQKQEYFELRKQETELSIKMIDEKLLSGLTTTSDEEKAKKFDCISNISLLYLDFMIEHEDFEDVKNAVEPETNVIPIKKEEPVNEKAPA